MSEHRHLEGGVCTIDCPDPELRAEQPRQTTAEDYKINTDVLFAVLGIEPKTVVPDTARITLAGGLAVLEYTARRAIPAERLGMAFLTAGRQREEQDGGGG